MSNTDIVAPVNVAAACRLAENYLASRNWRGTVVKDTAKRWTYGRPFWSVIVVDVHFPFHNELTPRDIGLLIFGDGEIKVCYIIGEKMKPEVRET